jgi:hypothetical protein
MEIQENDVDLPLDAQVICKDGAAGRSKSIIIDPIRQKVTHIAVAEKRFPHIERLVPLEMIDSVEDSEIQLRCTCKDFALLEPFIEIEYVTEEGMCPEAEFRGRFYWPHVLPDEEVTLPIEIERVPPGELAARCGMSVHALDEVVGVSTGAIKGASQVGSSLTDAAKGTVRGVVTGVSDLGGDVLVAARKATRGVIEGVAKVGGDLGSTAVAAVEGAVNAAGAIGSDTAEAAEAAATGAVKAATGVGAEAGKAVKSALLAAASLPRDVIEKVVKGSES